MSSASARLRTTPSLRRRRGGYDTALPAGAPYREDAEDAKGSLTARVQRGDFTRTLR
ncbi:hypothetical protein ACH4FE_18570 [Streptomyces celluloflavus]|uniref:hypothetical protein n=1 Tax=Streptomyces celluloflavus TaxID=58344 RepID=UPI0037B21DE3